MAQYRSKKNDKPKENDLANVLSIPTYGDVANNIIKDIKRFVTTIIKQNAEIRKLKKENEKLKLKLRTDTKQ